VTGQANAEHTPTEASTVTAEGTERANELYWGSERSVNQIADDLDLSKGALYAMIEPLATGLGCPLCGSEVAYPNRTAKERDRLDCPTCDWDGSADETTGYEEPDDDPPAALAPLPPASVTNARLRTIAGGALLGAAVGLALVIWARRR
jgi:predicted RNA-binding Zn-ribbon protein involved in translation (DUF1610 family)